MGLTRTQCRIDGCAAEAPGGWKHPFCMFHWMSAAEDLRERFRWACEDGDRTNYEAALYAVLQDAAEGNQ